MKKFTTMAICFVLIACMVAGGSLAYLTDRDSVANVFTVGDVRIELTEDFAQGATLTPGVDIKKEPIIKNTGINDAWVWAQIAFPSALDNDDASKNVVHFNYEADYVNAAEWTWTDDQGAWLVEKDVTINDAKYNVYTVLYQTALERGQETKPVMTNVYMDTNVDIDNEGNWSIVEKGVVTPLDWNTNTNGAPIIYVSAYAVQAEGFTTVQEAYAAYNEQWTTDAGVNNGLEWGTPVTLVETAEELTAALTAGESVALTADITADADETITIAAGKDVVLDLNGHKITTEADGTGNRELFLVKGNMEVVNGEISLTATQNQGWGAMATVFNITAGGALDLDGVKLNVGGTDMTFGVHMNNWGEVTLNMNDCEIKTNYCAVRVFNSGYDMNNVTIKDSVLDGGSCAFWVHNYTEADFGSAEKAADQAELLNFDIFNGTNDFIGSTAKPGPIRYGMTDSVYADANGNQV